ncbi:MAG: phosphate ABC transporter permease PstA [Actinomycetota bacterium]
MATDPPMIARSRTDWWGMAFLAAIVFCLVACFAFLVVLIGDVVRTGAPVFGSRAGEFLTGNLATRPEQAGVAQAIRGSLLLAAIVVVIAFPLGVATAVYLEEYAADTRFTRIIALNIRNLAGVPSVVYGLLGLAVFVQALGTDLDGGLTGGRSLLAGGLTLAILVLPIVIITAAEAIRAVPTTLREAGYGLGATRSDVVRTLVLPSAAPGVLTGSVLSLARALGETAPLILTGAVLTTYLSSRPAGLLEQLRGDYTALPVVIYTWARQAKPEFKTELASAAILVLLAITVLCNLGAVLLRNRYERRRVG